MYNGRYKKNKLCASTKNIRFFEFYNHFFQFFS